MQFIASARGSANAASIDTTTTLDVQAGDLLVACIAGDISAGVTISSVAMTNGLNSFTCLAVTSSWFRVGSAYREYAAAASGATFRVTLSSAPNSACDIIVLQFRPDARKRFIFHGGPASASSAYGSNPTSAQLNVEASSLVVGFAANDRTAISNNQIGGAAVDATVEGTSLYLDASYSYLEAAQSNVTYSTTSDYGVWGAQELVFKETDSFLPWSYGNVILSKDRDSTPTPRFIYGRSYLAYEYVNTGTVTQVALQSATSSYLTASQQVSQSAAVQSAQGSVLTWMGRCATVPAIQSSAGSYLGNLQAVTQGVSVQSSNGSLLAAVSALRSVIDVLSARSEMLSYTSALVTQSAIQNSIGSLLTPEQLTRVSVGVQSSNVSLLSWSSVYGYISNVALQGCSATLLTSTQRVVSSASVQSAVVTELEWHSYSGYTSVIALQQATSTSLSQTNRTTTEQAIKGGVGTALEYTSVIRVAFGQSTVSLLGITQRAASSVFVQAAIVTLLPMTAPVNGKRLGADITSATTITASKITNARSVIR